MNAMAKPIHFAPKFRGMLQIFFYNWPFYLFSTMACLGGAAMVLFLPMPALLQWAGGFAVTLGAFWLGSSLAASHYVYDTSKLYRFEWIADLFSPAPERWANIHAGLDETTTRLRTMFSETRSRVLDIYDPGVMSEPSIARARRWTPSGVAAERVSPSRLPFRDWDLDAAFLIFAAHEIRSRNERSRFFRELHRSISPGGTLLIIEHVRDLANFAVFGPGFLHFLPRKEWTRLLSESGFVVFKEFKITPFVRVWVAGRRS